MENGLFLFFFNLCLPITDDYIFERLKSFIAPMLIINIFVSLANMSRQSVNECIPYASSDVTGNLNLSGNRTGYTLAASVSIVPLWWRKNGSTVTFRSFDATLNMCRVGEPFTSYNIFSEDGSTVAAREMCASALEKGLCAGCPRKLVLLVFIEPSLLTRWVWCCVRKGYAAWKIILIDLSICLGWPCNSCWYIGRWTGETLWLSWRQCNREWLNVSTSANALSPSELLSRVPSPDVLPR